MTIEIVNFRNIVQFINFESKIKIIGQFMSRMANHVQPCSTMFNVKAIFPSFSFAVIFIDDDDDNYLPPSNVD
ncbi:hypothetical protein BLA29_000391 [Euroglyphus maynei]|uniref:Uncharacterized protein n=1 Tax=Euroglyphus maynei TaxID=6958 RepID=A0A1Y3B3N9_EURMA|nr:hypothetical protein BLA29_000391 [Euroglyphus maynei]